MATAFDPFREFASLAGAVAEAPRGPRRMPMDLYRDNDTYVLNADLPGIDPGSVDIDVDGQLLTIRAERTVGSGDGVKWITRERATASYLRQLSLGQGVDIENISANYDNGVLSIMIPVSERAKPRKIAVNSVSSEDLSTEEAPEEQLADA